MSCVEHWSANWSPEKRGRSKEQLNRTSALVNDRLLTRQTPVDCDHFSREDERKRFHIECRLSISWNTASRENSFSSIWPRRKCSMLIKDIVHRSSTVSWLSGNLDRSDFFDWHIDHERRRNKWSNQSFSVSSSICVRIQWTVGVRSRDLFVIFSFKDQSNNRTKRDIDERWQPTSRDTSVNHFWHLHVIVDSMISIR